MSTENNKEERKNCAMQNTVLSRQQQNSSLRDFLPPHLEIQSDTRGSYSSFSNTEI